MLHWLAPFYSLSHSLPSVFWDYPPNKLKGLLLREHTKTAPNGPSPVFTRLCSSRIHSSLAPSFCLTLFKFRRERLVLFLVRDKLIFLSQAAFRSGQYAHGWPPQGSYPPSPIIFSQEDRVMRLASRSTGLYVRRRHLSLIWGHLPFRQLSPRWLHGEINRKGCLLDIK